MRSRPIKAFIASATLVVWLVAVMFAWRGYSTAQAARTRLAAIAAQRAKLDADIAAIRGRVAKARHDDGELRDELKPVLTQVAKQAADAAPKSPAATTPATHPDTAASLEANPGLRALFRKSFQADLAVRYRPFYDTARLSPEQIRKFEQLMIEAEEVKMDFQATAKALGFTPADPALGTLRAQGVAELKAAATNVLGEEAYSQLLQFRRAEPLQVAVNDLAMLVAQSPTPLSAAQAGQLLTTMANASSRYRTGDRADLGSVDWPQALAQAQSFLAPAQIEAFKTNVQLQQVSALAKQFYQQQGVAVGK
jgi:hypothetical protein